MANFAELNENNEVVNIIVVDNNVLLDENENEVEQIGIDFLYTLFGSEKRFVQTSISGKIRKRLANIGMLYNETIDAFIDIQPYPSWTLDPELAIWIPPTPKPGEPYVYDHIWDEETLSWQLKQ